MLSQVFTFRILATLRSARRSLAAPFVHVGRRCDGGRVGARPERRHGTGGRARRRSTACRRPPIRRGSAAQGSDDGQGNRHQVRVDRERRPRRRRSAAETEKIRVALAERRDELQAEYDQTLSEITELQRDRLTDSAGDDQADTGTKTFEREQEITLANNLLERITQVERAIDRLGEGNYGWCERCGNAIPVERLAAFPSATLCVTCKQLEERR